MKLTLEELVNEIRGAETLEELKRLVGPSSDDEAAARYRISLIDTIWEKYGSFDKMPQRALEQYNRLMDRQSEYENMYC